MKIKIDEVYGVIAARSVLVLWFSFWLLFIINMIFGSVFLLVKSYLIFVFAYILIMHAYFRLRIRND